MEVMAMGAAVKRMVTDAAIKEMVMAEAVMEATAMAVAAVKMVVATIETAEAAL